MFRKLYWLPVTSLLWFACNSAKLSEFQQNENPYGDAIFDDLPISEARLKVVSYNGEDEATGSAIGSFTEQELQTTVAELPQPIIKEKAPRPRLYKSGIYPQPNIENPSIQEISPQETEHPYRANETAFEVVLNSPDARGMAIHFRYFNTEENYDILSLYDDSENLVAVYHGRIGNFWSEFIPGARVRVVFRSDGSNQSYGFIIDKIATPGAPPAAPEPPSSSEIGLILETRHGNTRGLGRKYKEVITVHQPGATALNVRLEKLHIDELCQLAAGCQVQVRIKKSENGAVLHTIKGRQKRHGQWLSELYQESGAPAGFAVTGERLILEYAIDTWPLGWVFNDYGFRIDRVRVQGVAPRPFRNEYPILLAHGIFGWDQVLGFDYFFRVADYLRRNNYEVYRGEVPAVGGLQARAEALKAKVDEVLSLSTAKRGSNPGKVNIIAHSMGGLDSRLLIAPDTGYHCGETNPSEPDFAKVRGLNYSSKVASLITISTPHNGSPVADLLWENVPGDATKVLASIVNRLVPLYNGTNPSANDARKALFHLTSEFTSCFNYHFNTEPPGILYRSYAGKTNSALPIMAGQDEVDLPLAFTYYYMKNGFGLDNDGMVTVNSAVWKPAYYHLYKGAPLHADHFNEIGQIAGFTDPAFNHYEFYLFLANELAAAGK